MNGAALTLTVTPSRRLLWVVAALHLLACAAVLATDLGWPYRLALVLAVAASLIVTVRRAPPLSLRCRPDGGLSVKRGGDWRPAELLPDTLVLAWLAVLRYRPEGQPRPETCVILPDSLSRDDFRALRVWLRWRGKVA